MELHVVVDGAPATASPEMTTCWDPMIPVGPPVQTFPVFPEQPRAVSDLRTWPPFANETPPAEERTLPQIVAFWPTVTWPSE